MKTLGELIREERGRKGLSVLELALRVGVAQSTISRLENDEYAQAPKPAIAQGLTRELGIPQVKQLELMGYDVGDSKGKRPTSDDARTRLIRAIETTPMTDGQIDGVLSLFRAFLVDAQKKSS